jgi:hypothetical protein
VAQSSARLLQERGALGSAASAPNYVSSLTTGPAFVWNVEPSLASIDPATAIGKHAPLLPLPSRAQRDGQQHLPT